MTQQPSLLVIGSGEAGFREYALRAMAAKAGITLASKNPATWETAYCQTCLVVDLDDRAAAIERLRTVSVDAILTYDERYVELTAELAELLRLPGPSVAAVRTVKDKSMLRALLQRESLAPVRFGVAATPTEARHITAQIGLPVVFKPRALGGSSGVKVVRDVTEIEDAFAEAAGARVGTVRSRYDGVLIEEYLDGPEYSVDCVTYRGHTQPLVVAEKHTGLDPYFEEIGHIVPPALERALPDEALALVRQAHAAAGLDTVVSHTELKLTSRGPRIIELNARLGGDLIPYLGLLAHGIDLAAAAADLALGRQPSVAAVKDRVAAVRFLYPSHDLRLHSITLPDQQQHPGLDRFVPLCFPDEELLLPPRGFMSRMAAAIVTGATQQACLSALDTIERSALVDATPLTVAVPS